MPHWRAGILAILILGSLAGVMALDPIAQDASYHGFADQRRMLGVPHLFDVASSLAFVIVGALGVAVCAGRHRPPRVASWSVVFAATILTGFGSAWYHWAPTDARLVWDRLPMAVAFMAFWVALLAEHAGEALERFLLAPALAAGVGSVLWWWWSGDLRLYAWVQFASLLCIAFLLAAFVVYGLGLYALAKAAEIADRDIFTWTGGLVSGHTSKHLLAAGAILALVVMLRRRAAIA